MFTVCVLLLFCRAGELSQSFQHMMNRHSRARAWFCGSNVDRYPTYRSANVSLHVLFSANLVMCGQHHVFIELSRMAKCLPVIIHFEHMRLASYCSSTIQVFLELNESLACFDNVPASC